MPEERYDEEAEAATGRDEQEDHRSDDNASSSACPSPDNETKKRTRDKALIEFRFRVEQAILGNYMIVKKSKNNDSNSPTANGSNVMKDLSLWGVPLLPSAEHEGRDVILMKFLKARDHKVHEAFRLLRKTLKWRADFRPDEDVDLGPETDNVWYTSGRDEEGRPLCYSVLGRKFWSADGKSSQDYLRWRVRCVEDGIRELRFGPGGVSSIVQIIDLKNAPGSAAKEVKFICRKMMNLLQDHYPGIVYKNLIINVPSWFLAVNTLNLRLITQRSRNKFIFVKPSRVTETLLKYATIENILVQYGGLRRENDAEFSTDDKVLETNVRANATEYINIPINEVEVTVTWDVTVIGYNVTYREEFIPDDDCSYKILLQEKKEMGESIRNSFHIREPGKIVITIGNWSFTKKKAFYRHKTRPSVPIYMSIK